MLWYRSPANSARRAGEVPVTSRPLRPVTPHDLTYPDYTTFLGNSDRSLGSPRHS